MGCRYRLHDNKLPGRPDLVFKRLGKIIFVNGCFWHQHTNPKCKISHKPKSNLSYWLPKLQKNKERDGKNKRALKRLGWDVYVTWECEIKSDPNLKTKIKLFLEDTKNTTTL